MSTAQHFNAPDVRSPANWDMHSSRPALLSYATDVATCYACLSYCITTMKAVHNATIPHRSAKLISFSSRYSSFFPTTCRITTDPFRSNFHHFPFPSHPTIPSTDPFRLHFQSLSSPSHPTAFFIDPVCIHDLLRKPPSLVQYIGVHCSSMT